MILLEMHMYVLKLPNLCTLKFIHLSVAQRWIPPFLLQPLQAAAPKMWHTLPRFLLHRTLFNKQNREEE